MCLPMIVRTFSRLMINRKLSGEKGDCWWINANETVRLDQVWCWITTQFQHVSHQHTKSSNVIQKNLTTFHPVFRHCLVILKYVKKQVKCAPVWKLWITDDLLPRTFYITQIVLYTFWTKIGQIFQKSFSLDSFF